MSISHIIELLEIWVRLYYIEDYSNSSAYYNKAPQLKVIETLQIPSISKTFNVHDIAMYRQGLPKLGNDYEKSN